MGYGRPGSARCEEKRSNLNDGTEAWRLLQRRRMLRVLALLSMFTAADGPLQVTATVIRPVQLRVSTDGGVTLAGPAAGEKWAVTPRIIRRRELVSIDF